MKEKKAFIEKYRKEHKDVPLSWLFSGIRLSPKCWNQEAEPALSEEDKVWKKRVEEVLEEFPYYGYIRVTKELTRRGYTINKKKTQRIMHSSGLLQKRRKRSAKTTDSSHRFPTYPNLVKDLIPLYPHHIWAADITYVRLPSGFCYVACIVDLFTRKIVGWSIALHMETELVMETLKLALEGGAPKYHHSDRGSQYCSHEYTGTLKENGVKISMANIGVSVDNPYAESFNRTLKVEEVYLSDYETIGDARASIKRFIEEVYNKKRLHSSLGYLPPEEFEVVWLKENESRVSLKTLAT